MVLGFVPLVHYMSETNQACLDFWQVFPPFLIIFIVSLAYLQIIFDMCHSWTEAYPLTKTIFVRIFSSANFLTTWLIQGFGMWISLQLPTLFWPELRLWAGRNLISAWSRKNSEKFTKFPVMTWYWHPYNSRDVDIKGSCVCNYVMMCSTVDFRKNRFSVHAWPYHINPLNRGLEQNVKEVRTSVRATDIWLKIIFFYSWLWSWGP